MALLSIHIHSNKNFINLIIPWYFSMQNKKL